MRLLIHANGDLERKDNAGLTPTNHAVLHGHTHVVCLLRELRGWPKRQRSEGEVEKLTEKGAAGMMPAMVSPFSKMVLLFF